MNATDLTAHPILFSGEMVRAILDGRKTQTRRVIRPRPVAHVQHIDHDPHLSPKRNIWKARFWNNQWQCPYGVAGDRLWVRERWSISGNGVYFPSDTDGTVHHAWKSALHLKRKDARIELEITDVRVQRVHKISDDDVRAEGVESRDIEKYRRIFHRNDLHALAFGELWNRINGRKHPWSGNPWVWAITFRRIAP